MQYEVGPVVMDKVDDEALDVGAILVLIGHDHQFAVVESPQLGRVSILLAVLKSQDFDNVYDLLVADLGREERNDVGRVLMVFTIHTHLPEASPTLSSFP